MVNGTVASLSPPTGTHPTLVSLQWFFDESLTDTMESGGAAPVQAVPATFGLTIQPPAHFMLDFEALRALPLCSPDSATSCWSADKPRLQGKGKLAIGSFLAFEDTDGNGQYTREPQKETLRGFGPLYVLYAVDLDAQAVKELGEMTLFNPQALKPGFNFARVRCKTQVTGWTGRFDPFEIVPREPITVESIEALTERFKAGEFCNNWS